jgi:hypothetical protein
MTWALCFKCGATKFGAICPCPECALASTGDIGLDIAFSDHHFSRATLQAFGAVIGSLRRVCQDDELRFWSFIHYVSTRHPDILGVTLSAEQRQRCEAVVAQANPPPVTIEKSERAKLMQELEGRGGGAGGEAATDRPDG